MSRAIQYAVMTTGHGNVLDLGANCSFINLKCDTASGDVLFQIVPDGPTAPTAPVATLAPANDLAGGAAAGRILAGQSIPIGVDATEQQEAQRLDIVGRWVVLWCVATATLTAIGKTVEAAS